MMTSFHILPISRMSYPVSRCRKIRNRKYLSLRPEYLSDYVGQAEVVETLKIAIEASMQRQ